MAAVMLPPRLAAWLNVTKSPICKPDAAESVTVIVEEGVTVSAKKVTVLALLGMRTGVMS